MHYIKSYFFLSSTWHPLANECHVYFFIPTENVSASVNFIFSSCAAYDEQLGKLVYNALETTSGSFVLLYEWVLQWQKKIGPFLTNQEREKIDKCKKQVGHPRGLTEQRT